MEFNLKKLEEDYNLKLDKIILQIKKNKARNVLLQFPDGLKPYATAVCEFLEENTTAEIKIWLGSCFGACDLPKSNADLLIQFGHAEW
ncbi:MAG: diphthamide synthesis protein [Nanoarchaeota archaeon]|nr:diphthamide synthesis protein [Nanoarchaeota archaeon]